jgi:hypothetical protein
MLRSITAASESKVMLAIFRESGYGDFRISWSWHTEQKNTVVVEPDSRGSLQLRGLVADLEVVLKTLEGISHVPVGHLMVPDRTVCGFMYQDIIDDLRGLDSVHIIVVRAEVYDSFEDLPPWIIR